MLVVTDNSEAIADFVGKKLKVTFWPPYLALGFSSEDRTKMAAVVFSDYNGSNIEATIYADKGGATRGVIRYVAQYVFGQLKCRRLTVRTKKRNKAVLKLAPRLGFKYETVLVRYYPDDDAVVFRMLREDCKWIKKDAKLVAAPRA